MNNSDVMDVFHGLLGRANEERAVAVEVDGLLTPGVADSFMDPMRQPHSDPNGEKARLRGFSSTPVLDLIVSEAAQQIVLEGISSSNADGDRFFEPFVRNGFLSRQFALWRAVIAYGRAYVMVLPGDNGAWIGCFSPHGLVVTYDDPLTDEYPSFALRMVEGSAHARLYDSEYVYKLSVDDKGEWAVRDVVAHNMGVCPVVQFSNDLDLNGRSIGDVEKFRVVAERLDKTTYDRVLAQHYNSWKVKTATGLDFDTQEDGEEFKVKVAQDDILLGGADVKFGTLPETSLDGLLRSAEADRDMLAAVSQTPVWALNGGQLVNLSADALIEARSMQRLKVMQKQRANGVNVARVARLAAVAEGRFEDANRYDLKALWTDVEAYSLVQVADGLQKLSTMGVPADLLITLIPSLTPDQVAEWQEAILSRDDPGDELTRTLARQLSNGSNG